MVFIDDFMLIVVIHEVTVLIQYITDVYMKQIIKSPFETIFLSFFSSEKEPKIIRSRQLKHYKPESFREDLATADWESLMNIEDVDLMSLEWERLF